jgi:hypothetical protein
MCRTRSSRSRTSGSGARRRGLAARARRAGANVRAGGIEEGSSTITMQLARNVFPEQLPANERRCGARSARRGRAADRGAVHEARDHGAVPEPDLLRQRRVRHRGGGEEYFGKPASQLTLAESAMLAALPRAPSRLNPRANRGGGAGGPRAGAAPDGGAGADHGGGAGGGGETRLVLREGAREGRGSRRTSWRRCAGSWRSSSATRCTRRATASTRRSTWVRSARRRRSWTGSCAIESGGTAFPHATYAGARRHARDRRDGTPYLQGALSW